MSVLELIAVAVGIVSVYFNTKQNVLGWPTSIINVALYTLIFYRGHLYALAALQVFYFVISVYGWYEWLRGGEGKTPLKVTKTPPRLGVALIVIAIVGTAVLTVILRSTKDPLPALDATLAVVSLLAQWMMARKYLETWPVWIGVNLVSVPTFFSLGNYLTAFLYTVFLGLAISGHLQWRKSYLASS
ncbi:MAG: nicotinamide riboside transporter PnuC [Gemmatimonadota bacterium]